MKPLALFGGTHSPFSSYQGLNYLLNTYEVRDISISEPEIEGIIRKIYNGEAC